MIAFFSYAMRQLRANLRIDEELYYRNFIADFSPLSSIRVAPAPISAAGLYIMEDRGIWGNNSR